MEYSLFGPFGLREGMALSCADPKECTQFGWGQMTYLETAGNMALYLGGAGGECSSMHAGTDLSTVIYDVPMVLAQVDRRQKSKFLSGAYICDAEIEGMFAKGMERLIDEKLDPHSKLNAGLNAGRERLRNMAVSLVKEQREVITESGILEPSHTYVMELESAGRKLSPKHLSQEQVADFVDKFYSSEMSKRYSHIGRVLGHLGIDISKSVIEGAIKEVELFPKNAGQDALVEKFLRECRNRPMEMLFDLNSNRLAH